MIPYERQLHILQYLETKEIASIEDFMKIFENVSESTIRRDLKSLAEEGQIVLLRGGGARLKTESYEAPLDAKKNKQVGAKEAIAKYAAGLVEDGDSIYLDSGSTTLGMIKYLKDKKITIVTTNALVYSELQGAHVKCYLVGGELNISTASIFGTTTNMTLMEKFFNKAFIGASGFSERAGISTPDVREAEKKQIVHGNSDETYVLMDSSKAEKNTMCKIYDLGQVPIICDKVVPILEKAGNYIIAK